MAIAAGLPWDITGVATALQVHSGVGLLIGLVPMMRIIGLPAATLWVAARGYLLAGAVLVGAVLAVQPLVDGAAAPVVLLVQAAVGALAYGGALLLVDRDQVLGLGLRLVRRRPGAPSSPGVGGRPGRRPSTSPHRHGERSRPRR